MLGSIIIKGLLFPDAPDRCKSIPEIGRKLTHIKRKVLRGQSRIRQCSPHIGITREEPSRQDKVPVKWGFRAKPVIKRIRVGDVLGLLQGEKDALM
jgi:hypothetical protein